MSQATPLPFFVFNLGVEMIYILEQRLEAQSIPSDKSDRVLKDLVSALCNSRFVDDLFSQQALLTFPIVRQLFSRIAHSSIMKLNQDSMEKLIELMFMTFKFQLTRLSSPVEIFQLTFNHLAEIEAVAKRTNIVPLVESVIARFKKLEESYTAWNCLVIRRQILNYLVPHRARISLLLNAGLQLSDGSLSIPVHDCRHSSCTTPGLVKLILANKVSSFNSKLETQNPVVVFNTRYCSGSNLYKNRPVPPPADTVATGFSAQTQSLDKSVVSKHRAVELNTLARNLTGGDVNRSIPLSLPSNEDVCFDLEDEVHSSSSSHTTSCTNFFTDLLQSLDVETSNGDDLLDLMDKL
ncbi:hypothetical protein RCL1_002314 [Eukaryota sp. TZLM3-RCL]